MKEPYRTCLRACLIVLGATFLDIALHQLVPSVPSLPIPPSLFVERGIVIPAVIGAFLLTFGLLAALFVRYQKRMEGQKGRKGALHGLAFGGLWFLGMLEANVVLGTPLSNEIFTGLADGIPILLMGWLLGVFVAADNATTGTRRNTRLPLLHSILVVALFYVAGRYVLYSLLHIDSGYLTKPLATFAWTLGMGFWIGVMYRMLRSAFTAFSPLGRALRFGLLVFGSDWILFNLFVALFYDLSLADLLLRSGGDAIFVSLGVLFSETTRK